MGATQLYPLPVLIPCLSSEFLCYTYILFSATSLASVSVPFHKWKRLLGCPGNRTTARPRHLVNNWSAGGDTPVGWTQGCSCTPRPCCRGDPELNPRVPSPPALVTSPGQVPPLRGVSRSMEDPPHWSISCW